MQSAPPVPRSRKIDVRRRRRLCYFMSSSTTLPCACVVIQLSLQYSPVATSLSQVAYVFFLSPNCLTSIHLRLVSRRSRHAPMVHHRNATAVEILENFAVKRSTVLKVAPSLVYDYCGKRNPNQRNRSNSTPHDSSL